MKVSRNYLKQVIKEEIQKLSEESEWYDEVLVKMPSKDFLELTTDQEILQMLKSRYDRDPMDYSEARAGDLLLNINYMGDVTSHEGRNRAYANIMKNGQNATNNVIIRISSAKYNEFLNSGYVMSGQYDKSVEKEPQKYPIIQKQVDATDFMQAGKEPLIFKPTIYPPNPYKKEETVIPSYREAITHIDLAQFEFVKAYKRKHGIENTTREEKHQLAKDFEKYANDNYNVYDDRGNKLKIVDASTYVIKFSLEPLPDPKAIITIEKK